MLTLPTKPEAITADPERSAVMVVDMQNAFASKGGMFDLSGVDISGARRVIAVLQKILDGAREAGMQIVYLQMGYDARLTTSGGPDSPNWHKEIALRLMRSRPEAEGKVLVEGSWDFAIVDELKPKAEDLVVVKSRYSGFAGTKLDSLLRSRQIRFLFFAGIAANVCVESTLRDAYFLDYWPILITDATMQAGPDFLKDATIHNVENHFGWTLTSENFIGGLQRTIR